jgi:uncharacterized membrane protein
MVDGEPTPPPAFEAYPLTRAEYINALVHLYRGEMHRASVWRGRLDTTTNWALVTSGGMLSFAFSAPDHSHVTLLLANFLALMFLTYEARRFRYFDVWRSRVRMLEENFFLPIIRRNLVSPRSDWREWVAEDLDQPKFKISLLEAIGMRLQRNYIWIFTILYVAWLAKLDGHPHRATSFAEVVGRMSVGPFGGRTVFALMTAFYVVMLGLTIWSREKLGTRDEIRGLDRAKEHWKT